MHERIVSLAAMKAADRYTIEQLGVPSLLLMSRAGYAVAEAVLSLLTVAPEQARVVIIAGGGNNGGDGLVAASVLLARGVHVHVCLTRRHLSDDAAACWQALRAQQAHPALVLSQTTVDEVTDELNNCDMIVDALFGTGLSRPVDGENRRWIHAINHSPANVLAVDIASGIEGDSGKLLGCAVQASWTLPVAASLTGQWQGEGARYAGMMLPAADIGIPEQAFAASEAAECWLLDRHWLRQHTPRNDNFAHKGSFGHLWLFAGSKGFTGAPELAASGASAAHAGLISLVCPDDVYPTLAANAEEHMVHPQSALTDNWQQADALLAGPGWGQQQHALLEQLLATAQPLLLDADALNILAGDPHLQQQLQQRQAITVLTPHPGEAARLLAVSPADIQADRFAAVRTLQARFDCVVILKGHGTLIADGKRLCLCPFGSSRLARGGSGDVLAGVCAALLARGMAGWQAACLAVGWHALAGEQNNWFRMAGLIRNIARLVQSMDGNTNTGACRTLTNPPRKTGY